MKKTILFSLSLIMILILSGCSQKQSLTNSENSNQVANQNLNQVTPQNPNTVIMENYAFLPQTLTVKKGTVITWENRDNANHQAVADSQPVTVYTNSLKTNIMYPGQTWSFTFDEIGTYPYHCSLHPSMTGTIIVTE